MKRAFAALMLVTAAAWAQEFKIGAKVTDFQVQDLDGRAVPFSALRGPVTVVIFISSQCPVSNAYNQRMNTLFRDYTSRKDVKFIFVNANQNEPASEVRQHAKGAEFSFPVYKDANSALADQFGAQVTPQSYIVDRDAVVRYAGSIDDSQNEARIRTRGLRLALDAVLAGKPVEVSETKAFGCSIKRARRNT